MQIFCVRTAFAVRIFFGNWGVMCRAGVVRE